MTENDRELERMRRIDGGVQWARWRTHSAWRRWWIWLRGGGWEYGEWVGIPLGQRVKGGRQWGTNRTYRT